MIEQIQSLVKTRYAIAIGVIVIAVILAIGFLALNPSNSKPVEKVEKIIKVNGINATLFGGNACQCTLQFEPVCASDGKTYFNQCFATCGERAVVRQGPCGVADSLTCVLPGIPSSSCDAQHPCGDGLVCFQGTCRVPSCFVCDNGQIVSQQNECNVAADAQNCPTGGEPVCTVNGQRFTNTCTALAAGISPSEFIPCRNQCSTQGQTCGGPVCVYASSPSTPYFSSTTCCGGLTCGPQGTCTQLQTCTTPLCTETDNGREPNRAGSTTGSLNGVQGTYTDQCTGSVQTTEYYCADPTSSNEVRSETINCPSDCDAATGNCRPITCTDTDGGNVTTSRGTVTNLTGSFTDTCATPSGYYSPGVPITGFTEGSTGSHVKEYTCNSNGFSYEACGSTETCSNGACVPLPRCEDADMGQNASVASYVTQRENGVTTYINDVCSTEPNEVNVLIEQYCEGDVARNTKITCTTTCSSGRCYN